MRELSRLIDANANRAAEAARTLEDVSRFMLDDGPLAARCKYLRHGLDQVLREAGFHRADRVAERDTMLDAGVANSASDAHERADLAEIIAAAGSRLGEALRVLEEALKTISPPVAARTEQIRYEGYDAERCVQRRIRVPRPSWAICVLISESLCTHHSWLDVAQAAIEGGADCLQLREKDLGDRELLHRARGLVECARGAEVAVVINDRPDIALLAGADGVHLGQDDLGLDEARRIGGERLLVGVSCSTLEQALSAATGGADLIGVGAMYPTSTKAKPSIAGPALLSGVLSERALAGIPHLAIGGIDAPRAAELAGYGCTGVAVSSAVCSAQDPAAAASSIRAALIPTAATHGVSQ